MSCSRTFDRADGFLFLPNVGISARQPVFPNAGSVARSA
jgi:hypothetical protein